jgi:hypothetical protein
VSRAAFDPLAFQANAFQITGLDGPVPFVQLFEVGLKYTVEAMFQMLAYRAGSDIYIRAVVRDTLSVPAVPFSPVDGVRVKVLAPDGSIHQDWDVMSEEAEGQFVYVLPTSTGDPRGVYSAEFHAQEGSQHGYSIPVAMFQLV